METHSGCTEKSNAYIQREKPFYDFGCWGCYKKEWLNSSGYCQLPGFSSERPDPSELCGDYKIIFTAVSAIDSRSSNILMTLRRLVEGKMTMRRDDSNLDSIKGDVRWKMNGHQCSDLNDDLRQFFEDFNFDFLDLSWAQKAACFRVNSRVGCISVASERKVFHRIDHEKGPMMDRECFESEQHETREAERTCESRHLSLLCKHIGFPCDIASLITKYLIDSPPFIFAEPGDIWMQSFHRARHREITHFILARRCNMEK